MKELMFETTLWINSQLKRSVENNKYELEMLRKQSVEKSHI